MSKQPTRVSSSIESPQSWDDDAKIIPIPYSVTARCNIGECSFEHVEQVVHDNDYPNTSFIFHRYRATRSVQKHRADVHGYRFE